MRLLTWAGVVVAALAALGATFHSLSSKGSSDAAGQPTARGQTMDQSAGIAYGDSAKQVLAKVGAATRKQGGCWVYTARAHTVHGAYLGQFADAVRYCFGDGPAGGKAVSAIEVHVIPHTKLDGKWYPRGWSHAMVILATPPLSS